MSSPFVSPPTPTPTPSVLIKHTIPLHSKDIQLLIAQHALSKLQALLVHSKAILIKVKNNNDPEKPTMVIPLVHYIVSMLGNTFDDQSQDIKRKIFSLGKLIPLIKIGKNYRLENIDGHKDSNPVIYTIDAPYRLILEQFVEIIDQVISSLKKKVQLLNTERDKLRFPKLEPIALKDLMNPSELQSMFKFIMNQDKLSSYQFEKVPIFTKSIEQTFLQIESFNKSLQTYKLKQSDTSLKKLPNWQFILQRIITSYIILLDQYSSLRSFGKNLYLPMESTLKNPKLVHLNKSLTIILKKCDDWFSNPEKNGPIISQLLKYGRNGSVVEATHKILSEMAKVVNLGVEMIKGMIDALNEFIKTWASLQSAINSIEKAKEKEKIKAQTIDSSNTKPLTVLIPTSKSQSSSPPSISSPLSPTTTKQILEDRKIMEKVIKERQMINNITNGRKIELRERKLREKFKESVSPITKLPEISRAPSIITRARSDSNTSISSSSSSTSSSLNSFRNTTSSPVQTSRISSPLTKSPTLTRSSSLQVRRPVSVYHSSAAFDIRSEIRRQERAAAASAIENGSKTSSRTSSITSSTVQPVIKTRVRSSSLQSQNLPSHTVRSQLPIPTAAAESALLNDHQHKPAKQVRSSSLGSKNDLHNKARRYLGSHPELVTSSDTVKKNKESRSPSPLRSSRKGLDEIMETPTITPEKTNPNQKLEKETILVTPLKSALKTTLLKQKSVSIPKATQHKTLNVEKEGLKVNDEKGAIKGDHEKESMKELSEGVNSLEIKDLENKNENITDQLISSAPVLLNSLDYSMSFPNKDLPSLKIDTSINQQNEPHKTSSISLDLTAQPSNPLVVTTPSRPIVKKVRFMGIPPESPESSTPKRKLWRPLQKSSFSSPTARTKTSLSYAAEALKQERLTFHSIRRGDLDLKKFKNDIIHDAVNGGRMMNSLTAVSSGGHGHHGKWTAFKDKFS